MTTIQRIRSDIATTDRRATTDQTVSDKRYRNDKLTRERRAKADKTVVENRTRNDETTANRREVKDGKVGIALAIFLLILVVFSAVIFFSFI